MNMLKPAQQDSFVPSAAVSAFVNDEMHQDSFFPPNLGGSVLATFSMSFTALISNCCVSFNLVQCRK